MNQTIYRIEHNIIPIGPYSMNNVIETFKLKLPDVDVNKIISKKQLDISNKLIIAHDGNKNSTPTLKEDFDSSNIMFQCHFEFGCLTIGQLKNWFGTFIIQLFEVGFVAVKIECDSKFTFESISKKQIAYKLEETLSRETIASTYEEFINYK